MVLANSMFDPFFTAFATVLAFFYDITGNYALAIILLTLGVMLIVTPLTLKGTRSMMMMQQLQPEMRKIQTRYKDDRQKLNEELLKFYKENSINPLGGCLPLLVQMPVFLVLYQVLHGLTRRVSDLGSAVGWVTGQTSQELTPTKPPSIERVFDPAWIDQSSKMYQDLSSSTQMRAFGLDLSESASKAFSTGFVHALPFLVLIAIVAITGVLQQRQIQGRNPNAQVNPQQQMIMKIMPIFLPVISFGLPAGLVLYFAVSNMYRIGQQAFISHSIYGGRENGMTWKDMFGLGTTTKSGSSKPKAKSSSAKGKGKAIAASSRPSSKASAKSSARTKTPAKTTAKASSSRSAGSSAQKSGSTPARKGTKPPTAKAPVEPPNDPAPASDDSVPTPEPSPGRGRPTPPSSGAGDGGTPNLQPRARRKKR
ncbi:MAG TPA: membrane protein insertase YidC [Acidimicrobiales bacterium]